MKGEFRSMVSQEREKEREWEGGREGERVVAGKMACYMWRVKRRIWEMNRQIPSLLELIFRIKLAKITKKDVY